MSVIIKISIPLFTGLLIAGCAMPMGTGMKTKQLSLSNPPPKHIVYSNEVCQEFIDGVKDMALGLLTCDAISKASRPPLIVIRPVETEGKVSFDTTKYAETERNILVGKAGNKVRFIDKETTEEANYYLYGIISQSSIPSSNDSRNDIRKKRFRIQSATIVQQAAASNQNTDNNNSFTFTISLVDPHSNATIWKDECRFALKEIQQYNRPK